MYLETISDLEITLDNLFSSFCYNNFKANASKCHLFLLPLNAKSINIKNSVIEGSSIERFLGITIDINFTVIFQIICTINCMFGRAIWDKLPECIFENFEIAQVKRVQF